MSRVTQRFDTATIVRDTLALVDVESPSSDLGALQRSADAVDDLGTRILGRAAERIILEDRCHLRWTFGSGSEQRVLLLGHHDTVWPVGSRDRLNTGSLQGRMTGPGCFDMKAGLAMIFHAVAALPERDGVTILVTADEELGAPSSRQLIKQSAAAAGVTLVAEAAQGTALKTARSGVSLYRITVQGVAAHAGLEPAAGVNAALIAARLALAIADLDETSSGSTVTPTTFAAGTTSNTVPDHAEFAVDVRCIDAEAQARIDDRVRAVTADLGNGRAEVHGGPRHRPLEPRHTQQLFALADRVNRELGYGELASSRVGGASDGNIAAEAGSLVLDGMGAVGDGAHAEHEHVREEFLAPRTELLSELVRQILGGALDTRPIGSVLGIASADGAPA